MSRSWAAGVAGSLIDLLLPASCCVCQALLDHNHTMICEDCLEGFEVIQPPVCGRCGQPIRHASRCADCRREESSVTQIRSPLVFGGACQEAILKLKLGGKVQLAPWLAEWIARADLHGLDLGDQDLLVPVPLHRSRLAQRGFNQAVLLARALSRQVDVRLAVYHLIRQRATPSQFSMAAKSDRMKNVEEAFGVVGRHPFSGKRICLVDDVVTTGSTLAACAKTLRSVGAKSVVAVTVARTVHD